MRGRGALWCVVGGVGVLAACGAHEQIMRVSPGQLGGEGATARAFLRRDGAREVSSGEIDPSFLQDEATLLQITPRACVRLVLQTETVSDVPLARLRPTCWLDGQPSALEITSEHAAQGMYWYQKENNVTGTPLRGVAITTRAAEGCCAGPVVGRTGGLDVALELTHRELGDADGKRPWREVFRWRVVESTAR